MRSNLRFGLQIMGLGVVGKSLLAVWKRSTDAPSTKSKSSDNSYAVCAEVVKEAFEVKGKKMVIATTGSGGHAIRILCQVPGMSQVVMEINVPYARESSTQYMGACPEPVVSEECAIMLAKASYQRALNLGFRDFSPAALRKGMETEFIGLGCTAAVVSNRPRRGLHHAFAASYNGSSVKLRTLVMDKGRRDRKEEDECVGRLILRTVADALEIEAPALSVLTEGGEASRCIVPFGSHTALQRFCEGQVSSAFFFPSAEPHSGTGKGLCEVAFPKGSLILPGSFNPLHEGHIRLGQAAQRVVQEMDKKNAKQTGSNLRPLVFELSLSNPDKGTIDAKELKDRISRFGTGMEGPWPVVITRCSLFTEKSKLFPGCWFVVGADTAIRIVNPKYYGNDKWAMFQAVGNIFQSGVRLVVGARVEKSGKLESLTTIYEYLRSLHQSIFEGLAGGFIEIPSSTFRLDISSTQIRNNERCRK